MFKTERELKNTIVAQKALRAALDKKLLFFLGDEDNDPDHPSLRRTEEAMGQGRHRFERGLNFLSEAEQQAKRLGITRKWTKHIVKGVGHDYEVASAAAELL